MGEVFLSMFVIIHEWKTLSRPQSARFLSTRIVEMHKIPKNSFTLHSPVLLCTFLSFLLSFYYFVNSTLHTKSRWSNGQVSHLARIVWRASGKALLIRQFRHISSRFINSSDPLTCCKRFRRDNLEISIHLTNKNVAKMSTNPRFKFFSFRVEFRDFRVENFTQLASAMSEVD